MPETMKAVRIHTYGGLDVLSYEDAPRPQIAEDEILVRVCAAGVNPVDWKIREGYLAGMLNHSLPLILGWDVSGKVVEVGAAVSEFKVGDAVYARPDINRDGAYAEFIAIKAAEVAFKPSSLNHVQAAAVPLAGLTAWKSLFDAANLQAGQRVLIHAASGGVGSYAVQLAGWKGADAIGTASARNLDFLRELGVKEAIDYQAVRFEEVVRDVDVVFDTIGGDVQERSWQVLKPGGVLVSVITPPPAEMAAQYNCRGEYVFIQPDAAQLTEIAQLIDAGYVKPIVETTLPLADVRQAHQLSQSHRARGKIVLQVLD
ncbi:NADP-dependent oxidoreductase [Aerosakkonema funiforme]|uniref:NADP-dependent oxidoreductase n=1 Tax=Aerosakkonema funiforme TaxID=1246630 RepID=UPI0035B92ED9